LGIKELGYLIFGSPDLFGWKRLATEIAGLQIGKDDSDALYLKMDDRDFRIAVLHAEEERLVAAGLEMASKDAFDEFRVKLEHRGETLHAGTDAECAIRRVRELFWLTDPDGNRAEIYWGPISRFDPFLSPLGVSAFVTGKLGLGHVVLPVTDLDRAQTFWSGTLGFGLSDILTMDFGGHEVQIYFNHCENGRQHSVALARMPAPSGCVHFMLEMPTLTEVGKAMDRVENSDLPIVMTIGQHVNDECVSFYFLSPNGYMVELGWDGVVKDWSKHSVFETTLPSLWGHRFIPPAV
jgi:3,4-dihydroxy-9,10-secoandrosta-1,3,5(10)-triene-9,17-dione 4,5-dioxygenase